MATYRRIQMTGGEDGDVMFVRNTPLNDEDCTYKGYKIENASCEGYHFIVTNLYTNYEVRNIPIECQFDKCKLINWLDTNMEDMRPYIKEKERREEEARKAKEAKKAEMKKKNEDKYFGVSSSTFYKVRSYFDHLEEKECLILTKLAIKSRSYNISYTDNADRLLWLHKRGLLKMSEVKKFVSKLK